MDKGKPGRAALEGLQFPPEAAGINPMSSDEYNRMTELEDMQRMLYALREIAEFSDDADAVRVAMVTLSTTKAGQDYLEGNPIKL